MSASVNSSNSGPYLSSDRTELAPLCSTNQDTKGLRVVVSFLSVLTVLVSLALLTQLHHGDYQVVPHGTVVSDNTECSFAGVEIMKKGGNAVDAVISTLFCLSVVLPHLVGIGGGGYILVFDQRRREVVGCLDFQATMGSTYSNVSHIGVPGFVLGLYHAHKTHGKLPWASLLNAAIEMAGSGFTPSANLLSAVPLASDQPELVDFLKSGHNPSLFTTLQILSQNGSDELYHGSLSEQMAKYVSAEDLAQYKVVTDTCMKEVIGQYSIAVAGVNSGGPKLLRLLHNINQNMTERAPVASVAFNLKETMVVSSPYSSGVNVVAADHNDIYVSAVSGLGSVLGSKVLTSGGYLMNNIFSSAPTGKNNRPSTLATPIIITQSNSACGNRFILGANDVRDAAQLMVEMLPIVGPSSNISMPSVIAAPRVRVRATQVLLEKLHQPQLDQYQMMLLQSWNFTMGTASEPYPSINVIHKFGDDITAVADSRGGGSPATF